MDRLIDYSVAVVLVAGLVGCGQSLQRESSPLLTVEEAHSLPTAKLAGKVLGPYLGRRIIEAVRYGGESGPLKVEFYSQPEVPSPRLNRICSVDVITVEYDWDAAGEIDAAAPLNAKRVTAESRYKAFDDLGGDPGTDAYDRFSIAACAKFRTATDAFRAPSAGDAQWLAAIEDEYLEETNQDGLPFSCEDFADSSCARARTRLSHLVLRSATSVELVDCDASEQGWFLSRCYRLTFPYARTDDVEWELSVMAGIRTGSSPVEIRSLSLRHVEEPLVLH